MRRLSAASPRLLCQYAFSVVLFVLELQGSDWSIYKIAWSVHFMSCRVIQAAVVSP